MGRAVRLCVTRAVHLVLHPGFVRISGKPRYAGYDGTSGGVLNLVNLRRFFGIRLLYIYGGYLMSSERARLALVEYSCYNPKRRKLPPL